MTETAEAKQRIRRVGRTEMDFPHQGKILTAVHPFYGPANSRNLQDSIRQDGYKKPTSAELTSFVHEYFKGEEPQAQEVADIMKNRYFRGFTGILYLPREKIAHFISNPEFDQNSFVDRNNLLNRIDESYAQVPFEHLRKGKENVPWKDVAKNPYFVAWAGDEEGAEKLAELASIHPLKEAYVFVPDVLSLRQPEARVAALGFGWLGYGLGVFAAGHGDGVSCAFGVK